MIKDIVQDVVVDTLADVVVKNFLEIADLNRLAHWDSSVLSSLTLSGSNVTQWDDISGNGYDVVQATGADQPTLESGGVRFTNDHLTGVGNNVGSEYSIFLVAKNNIDNPGDLRYYFGTGGGGGTASLHFGRRLNFYRLSNGTNHVDISNIPSIGDTFLYSITNKNSGSSIKLNSDTAETGISVPVTGNTNYEIGSGFSEGARELLDSIIYEILIIEETDSKTISDVTQYLQGKWNTSALNFENSLTRLAHWDSTRLDTLTLSGSNVTQWDDISGNGYDAVQATGSSQPVLESGGVRFQRDFLKSSGSNLASKNFSVFIVFELGQSIANYDYIFGTDGVNSSNSFYIGKEASNWWAGTSNNHVAFTFSEGSEYILNESLVLAFSLVNGGSSVFKNIDSLLVGENNFSQLTVNNNYIIGSGFADGGVLDNALIKEILIIEETDATTIQNVTYYLANKHQTERLPQP